MICLDDAYARLLDLSPLRLGEVEDMWMICRGQPKNTFNEEFSAVLLIRLSMLCILLLDRCDELSTTDNTINSIHYTSGERKEYTSRLICVGHLWQLATLAQGKGVIKVDTGDYSAGRVHISTFAQSLNPGKKIAYRTHARLSFTIINLAYEH